MGRINVAVAIAFVALSSYRAAGDASPETAMVLIEGGSYPVGSEDGTASARPAYMIALEPFRIDATDVTNAQFTTFRNTLEVTTRRNVAAGELRPAIPIGATDTLVFDAARTAERW